MLYAILSPDREAPWGYATFDTAPTLEQLADHMAEATGFASRDDWWIANHVTSIGYAPVQ